MQEVIYSNIKFKKSNQIFIMTILSVLLYYQYYCITILSLLQSLSLQSLLLFNVILSNINFIITIT